MRMVPKLSSNSVWILFIWVCFIESTKVNCRLQAPFQSTPPKKDSSKLPIETSYKLPAPIPGWPTETDTSFGTGKIDLAKLQVYQIKSFNKVWTTYEYGPDNLGATFFEPTSIPEDFFMLGCYSQPNNQPLYGWVLVAKDVSSPAELPGLKLPTDYTLLWSSESHNISQDGVGYFWLPVAPDGYTPVGLVVTTSPQKPPLDKIRVVQTGLTESVETDTWIWGAYGFHLYSSRPEHRGTEDLGVSLGTFIAAKNKKTVSLSCLSNLNKIYPSMPTEDQMIVLIQAYAPVVYFHPQEKYLPSSVNWFFQNGAILYRQGHEFTPAEIAEDGSNLPQNGTNDGAYWIDLPQDTHAKERDNLKKGNLSSAEAYMHIKPALGCTFTDVVVWLFYPYNGPGKIRIGFITIPLGEIGHHVGDWEHVTLRVSNFDGELSRVYFSQHGKGIWVSAPDLEFERDNNPIVYASKNGHASYPKAGEAIHTVLLQEEKILIGAQNETFKGEEKFRFGAENDTSKSDLKLDTAKHFDWLSADYPGGFVVDQKPWLNYAREWGPKRVLDVVKWLLSVRNFIPSYFSAIRIALEQIIQILPAEVIGEQGPIGPKWKDSWSGDEKV